MLIGKGRVPSNHQPALVEVPGIPHVYRVALGVGAPDARTSRALCAGTEVGELVERAGHAFMATFSRREGSDPLAA